MSKWMIKFMDIWWGFLRSERLRYILKDKPTSGVRRVEDTEKVLSRLEARLIRPVSGNLDMSEICGLFAPENMELWDNKELPCSKDCPNYRKCVEECKAEMEVKL